MKIGLIIIFHHNETQIDKGFFIEKINQSEAIELCLVDNNSKDYTLNMLKEIKEACSNCVSVVEIKKKVSEGAAKRAGARYMFNQFNLKHIGFINANAIEKQRENLNMVVESFFTNKNSLIDFNLIAIEEKDMKQTFFKSVFSVVEYLKQIKTNTNFNNLNPSV